MDRLRASQEQIETLVDFMERNGDIGRPQKCAQGRLRQSRMWLDVQSTLNNVDGGHSKPAAKWKKVWADLKTRTKKKAATITRGNQGTGGGPNNRVSLSPLEERVLVIMGDAAVSGQRSIEEMGFDFDIEVEVAAVPDGLELDRYADEDPGPSHSRQEAAPTPPSLAHSGPRYGRQDALSSPQSPQPRPLSQPHPPPRPLSQPHPPLPAGPALPSPRPLRPPPPLPPTPAPPRLAPAPSPHSSAANSPRRLVRRRERRLQTPLERSTSQFVAVEQHRLQLEEERDRRLHERELRQMELEARRLDMEKQRLELDAQRLEFDRQRLSQQAAHDELLLNLCQRLNESSN